MEKKKLTLKQKERAERKALNAIPKITCAGCSKTMAVGYFYMSNVKIHLHGRVPYCKTCVKKMICDDKGNVTMIKIQNTLQLINRPFLYDIWLSSLNAYGDTFGIYIKQLALPQFKKLSWKDSCFEAQPKSKMDYTEIETDNFRKELQFFDVTNEIILKWGFGYPDIEYQAFERKYQFLKNNYPEKTAMHTEALLNYVRYRVKEELSTAQGNVKDAKEWGGLADRQATAAKINPSQLSKADLQDGLNSFGELTRAVEKEVDIINILPQFKESPKDKPEFVLWCYINYIRDLQGLGLCAYKDIWAFYEERKNQYADKFNDDFEGDMIG